MAPAILMVLLLIVSVFMILLILVQRGKGGGLVGAFGGGGGQSAFGAKAGDLFTKITVVTACIWIVGCIILLLVMKPGNNAGDRGFGDGKTSAPAESNAPVTTPTPMPLPSND